MTDAEGNEIGKLFVGGLSQATNNGSLRLYFSHFGEVDDAIVMMDNKTGRSRGFGYVKYREPESVNLALEAKPHILDGKEVDAKQCNVNMKGRNRRSLKIFVGGIGLDQDSESIKNYFRQFGHVTDVNLMMDSNKQRHRGFAFVGFEDESVVKRLISMHYVTMNNKQVEIKAMEPPNFVRKIGSTTTVMSNGAAGDVECAHMFDHSSDPTGLLANGLSAPYGAHHNPYMSPQTPGITCAQHNMLGQSRPSPPNVYDQHGNFGPALLTDGLFQPTAYIQSMSPAHYTSQNPSESILQSTPASAGSYVASKSAVSFILANGQLHPSNGTSLTSNGLSHFNPNASSVYATIPYHLIPPQFMPHPQAPGVAQVGHMLNAEKAAALGAWPAGATHLTICPPSHVVSQNGMITCSQFPTNPSGMSASSVMPSSGQVTTNNTGAGSLLTPYYAVCPQYAIQLPVDSLNTTTQTNPSNLIQSGVPGSCNLQNSQPGAGDSTILQLTSQSQPSSPNQETKTEPLQVSTAGTPKLVYPTILMSTQNGLTNSSVVGGSNPAMNVSPALWNPNASNMVYPHVPVGWTVHTGSQGSPGSQPWHAASVAMIPQATQLSVVNANGTLKMSCQGQNNPPLMSSGIVKGSTSMDLSMNPPAKASGDTLDGLVNTEEFSLQDELNGCYRSVKNPGSGLGDRISEPQQQHISSQLTELTNWQTSNAASSRNAAPTLHLPPPSWPNSPGPGAMQVARWTECTQLPVNFTGPANMVVPLHPWTSPLELIEDTNAAYELAMNAASLQSMTSPTSTRRSASGMNMNKRTSHPPAVSTAHGSSSTVLSKSSCESNATEALSHALLSNGYTRVSSSRPPNQQQQTPAQVDQQTPSNGRPNNTTDQMPSNTGLSNGGNGSCGVMLSNELNHPRELNNVRLDYASWLYQTSGGTSHMDGGNGGDAKEISSATGVEIECQGPAGAAGDFHRPIVHTNNHLAAYHLTR